MNTTSLSRADFVIFDTIAGFLQWSGCASSSEAALQIAAREIGIDTTDDLRVHQVSRAKRRAFERWQVNGAPAARCPSLVSAIADDSGIFGRVNDCGDVDVLDKEGRQVKSLDGVTGVYPVGSDLCVGYEHADGIVLTQDDAEFIGLEIEDDSDSFDSDD